MIVSVNHRLAPKSSITVQLADIKRAIRWTRANISRFGGDPGFISVMGGCSGGHLATMAAITSGSEHQPGFEDCDTTVQACVSIAGFYDVTHDWGYAFNHTFDDKVFGGLI